MPESFQIALLTGLYCTVLGAMFFMYDYKCPVRL